MSSREHCIVSDPQVCHGKPCVRGTRITVSSDTYDEAELRRLAENVVRV